MLTYNVPGHICPKTGRIAMTIADAYARPDSADRTFWCYYPEAESLGVDPWRLIDGMDTSINGATYVIDWDAGGCVSQVPAARAVYMQRTRAERHQDASDKAIAAVLLWREFMRNNYSREDMPDLWDPMEEAFNAIKVQA